MKKILGLDLGTNSIGWALTKLDFDKKEGQIKGIGSRIIPMSQDILGKFDSGVSISQTAERTAYRGTRRLYQRDNLRRERLHRVLNVLEFLPEHYKNSIIWGEEKAVKEEDWKKLGQFKENEEVKLNYRKNESGKYEFIFMDSFNEMIKEFEQAGQNTKIPHDWTLYYLRKKALKEKISKQELAWLILNFNQKRGYYQLRGEEEEAIEGKEKTFEILKVDRLVDSGETIKKTGDKLYTVFFTNGWEYFKPVVKTENWIDKTKEFIVTTSTLANGEIKRTYKAVDSEKDWIAIKEKAQQNIDNYNKQNNTVGVANYIYDALLKNLSQKIRGKLIKTIERKYYKEELEKILETQIKLQAELFSKEKYFACIDELYPRNESHQNNIKDKGFKYLFVDDIIFYQRPLKSKKSTISGCQYEYKIYKKTNKETGEIEIIKEPIKGISKSHPLFQEFRLWQFLKNLKIYQKEAKVNGKTNINHDVTNQLLKAEKDWLELFDFLNDKKEIEQKQIIGFFVKQKLIDKKEEDNYRWNYVEDKKYPANETRATFLSRLKKVEGFEIQCFDYDFIKKLWHIIYSVKDKVQFEQALKTFARKNNLDKDSFLNNFKKYPPFKNDYGAYSEKALKKILPLMRMGKYWDKQAITQEVKDRIASIMEGVNALNLSDNPSKKEINENLEKVVDDDIPKQLMKSFIPFKDKNPHTALNTYQACYAVYNRHSEVSEITQWKSPEDIDKYLQNFKQHSLRNPIVEQVVTETLRTVRDIWKEYGNFDEIHLELGREMKNPADKRKQITQRVTENQNTNERIRLVLKELMNEGVEGVKDYSPSHQEILKIYEEGVWQNPDANFDKLSEDDIIKIRKNQSPSKAKSVPTNSDIKKYKLWLEQKYISPYTGKPISLSKLFTTDYQIEHIIPQSRYFDNSMSNKIICESEVNELKSNKTAYEFIKNNEKRVVDLSDGRNVELFNLKEYEAHCEKYFKKNRTKLKNLLSEDIPESFIKRQLNDSRYISKLIKGLLSNIVREEGEREATSKNIVTLSGSITSKLKQDWGLNEVWNKIVEPRFMRLNKLTGTNDYGYWDYQKDENGKNTGKQFFRTKVPDEIAKGFNKKRIDHRHHALDALVIACTTKDHVNYITSLNTERNNHSLVKKLREIEQRQKTDKKTGEIKTFPVATNYHKPWATFTTDAKNSLEKTIISFKQNLRVINKTVNKYQKYVKQQDGSYKKELVEQKGTNWAIRKPLHEKTYSAKIDLPWVTLKKDEVITATRKSLDKSFNENKIKKITDTGIQQILLRYLKQEQFEKLDKKGKIFYDSELAFSPEGIEKLNKNIKKYNKGKEHKPIYKVRYYEKSKGRFKIGIKWNNDKKHVQGAPNLFFAIYETEGEKTRTYETIPFQEVVKHQKWRAEQPKEERKNIPMIPIKSEKGHFLFSLSPNDLVYVPTGEEIENPNLVNFDNLSKEQIERIYKMVSSSGNQCFFIKNTVSTPIKNKYEFSALNKMEKSLENVMIKSRCWKLKVNRLGRITDMKKIERKIN